MNKDRFVYSVVFFAAPLPGKARQKFFLFSSLAAIYDVFSAEQIGCTLGHLYNQQLSKGAVFTGQNCIVKRERVYQKRHRDP